MFWSVHDHPYGRNRARVRSARAAHSVAADSMSTAIGPGRPQIGPLGAAYDVVGAGERAGVDGAARQRLGERLGEHLGVGAFGGAPRVAGFLGDDQVPGVHPGDEAGAEA